MPAEPRARSSGSCGPKLRRSLRRLLPWVTVVYLALLGLFIFYLHSKYFVREPRKRASIVIIKNTSAIPTGGRCTNGPYLYEEITGSIHEGLGMLRPKIVQSMLLARFLNLSHVFNSDWFDNEHHADYSLLYDWAEDRNCNEQMMDQMSHPHLTFVDIEPYLDAKATDLFSLCSEYISSGSLSRSTLNSSSLLGQFLDSSDLRGPSTVYRLHREYSKDYFDTSSLVLYPDCLQLLPTAFRRRKMNDLKAGKRRFIAPQDKLIIAFYFRWGDRGYNRNITDTNLHDGVRALKHILNHPASVLRLFCDYYIYFISEASHKPGEYPPSRTKEFDFIRNAFPSDKIEIRIDPTQFVEDFDIMTSSHIHLTTVWSSFLACQFEVMNISNTMVIVPWTRQLDWNGLLDSSVDESVAYGRNRPWRMFNELYCCINAIQSLNSRCSRATQRISILGDKPRTCKDVLRHSLSNFGSTATHNAYYSFEQLSPAYLLD